MAHEEEQEGFLRDDSLENRVTKQSKTDWWQTIGVFASFLFGIWGAGLSSWQYYESKIRDSPIIYGLLTVSPSTTVISPSGYDVALKIHNAGTNTITLEPTMQLTMFAPNGSIVPHSYFKPELSVDEDENVQLLLPLSIDPGKSGVIKKRIMSPSEIFKEKIQYAVIITDSRNQKYRDTFSENSITVRDKDEIYQQFEYRVLIRL
ncbi:MAG: hypothetical protein HOP03_00065 [Lysobacter sp.]|nr:hypothetical protein [Lysobacter sp.]